MGLFLKKNFSTLNSTADNLYHLTENDVKVMHSILLSIYKDVLEVCERNNIRLAAAGGTALGAVRHKGFIPWDDDMDLFLFREDFNHFIDVFEKELSDKYILLAPGYKTGANCFLPRIFKKDTTLLNMIDEIAPYPHGIYIDINLIEYAPNNPLVFSIKAFIANVLRFVSYSVYWHQYKSQSLKEYMLNSSGKNYYRLRMLIGRVFSFLSAEKWFKFFDDFVQFKKSRSIVIPSGKKKYAGEHLPYDSVIPLVKVPFEDTYIYVFNDYDGYLTNLYGEYMTIPAETEREYHLCLKFNIEKEI